jgi:hypothetical protein
MLRLASPKFVRTLVRPPRPDRIRPSAEWVFFLACVAVTIATIWWRIRTTGPVALAAGTLLLWGLGLGDRRPTVRRLAVLLVAFAAAYVVRNYAHSLLAHRGGRLALVAGLMLTDVLSLPTSVVGALSRLADAIAREPNGKLAALIAAFGVALPATISQSFTTDRVWTGDTIPLVPTVVELWTHGDRELSRYLPGNGYFRWDVCGRGKTYFVREVPGAPGAYSTYPAGMEPFAWPGVLLADTLGFDLTSDVVLQWIEKLSAAVLSGVCLALFFLIALHVGTPGAAFAVTVLLVTGSVFTSTLGMLLWQQGGVVFWMLLTLLIEFRSGGKPGWAGALFQGVACGSMLACRPSAVTFLIPFGLWVFARDWRRGVTVPLVAGVAFVPWAVVYYSLYRNPFGPAMGFLDAHWYPGRFVDGVLFSPARGLFVFQPWLVLLVLLIGRRARADVDRTLPTGWAVFAITIAAAHVFLVGSWQVWWGGFCYGSRLAAEVVPVAALFVVRPVGWLLETRWGWAVVAAVGVVGFAVHAPCAYYDAWLWNALPISADAHPERLWDWSDPPFLYGLLPAR